MNNFPYRIIFTRRSYTIRIIRKAGPELRINKSLFELRSGFPHRHASNGSYSLKMSDYAKKYWNNISVKDKGELLEEDQLHKESIQNFTLVENRIDQIIKGAKWEITILFSNTKTVKRKETQSILKLLKNKTRPNILVRALFPLGIDDIIIDGYSEVANVRIFERKLENNDIIIVLDDTKVLLVSTKDPIDYGKETAYTISYSNSKEITYVRKIVVNSDCDKIGGKINNICQSNNDLERYLDYDSFLHLEFIVPPSDIRRAGLNKTRSNLTIGWSSQSLFLKRIPILLVFSAS